MNQVQHAQRSVNSWPSCPIVLSSFRAAIPLFTLAATAAAHAQSAPKLVSVTPADGATAGYRVLANGHPDLNLSATAGNSFTIQRTGSLSNPNWGIAGNVTVNVLLATDRRSG